MAYVYKQFTAQDKALIPFNAHKQYNFTSASAATNSIKFYSSRWTSESYDVYSSGSASADINANVIKYNQIDKLYYRDYFSQLSQKLGPIEYHKQPRNLYEMVNILSIPMGLYGNKIKPGSFYMSASKYQIIDDKYGNLIISGSDTGSYPTNIQENIFKLDPIKGFKKYDLGVYEGYATVEHKLSDSIPDDYSKRHYRRGERIPVNIPTSYTTNNKPPIDFYSKEFDKDDSYFRNNIYYNKVTFNTSSLGHTSNQFPKINFDSTLGAFVSASHSEMFNFNGDQDFAISFWIKPKGVPVQEQGINNSTIENGFIIENYQPKEIINSKKRYVISKSRRKTSPTLNTDSTSTETPSETQFPYEIYMKSSSLYFDMADENETKSITTKIEGLYNSSFQPVHIVCQNSGSIMELWKNGTKVSTTTTSFKDQTRNTANLYIATSGTDTIIDQSGGVESSTLENGFVIGNYVNSPNNNHRCFNGDLNNINIWTRAFNEDLITNISESVNGSPYIGNIFYQNGFATITHPSYRNMLNSVGIGSLSIGPKKSKTTFKVNKGEEDGINTLQFQGTHLLYEHEYQCTVQEHEFNSTTNLSARKIKSSTSHELADFTTGSLFKPHVTTIGLYDDYNNLLVVGKLGQAIRTSDETDTTFIVRWDT
jgi:hypothetical protein